MSDSGCETAKSSVKFLSDDEAAENLIRYVALLMGPEIVLAGMSNIPHRDVCKKSSTMDHIDEYISVRKG